MASEIESSMFDLSWITTSWTTVLMVLISSMAIYASLILLTRLAGLRSFSKMSGFDFATTVGIGTVLAGTLLNKNPPLLQGIVALAILYGLQLLVAVLRQRSSIVSRIVDNEPLLLMAGEEILRDNLRRARVTEADLRAKLREANVIHRGQIRAVVFETTGDVSVLHAPPDGPPLDLDILEGVRGLEQLRAWRRQPAVSTRERAVHNARTAGQPIEESIGLPGRLSGDSA